MANYDLITMVVVVLFVIVVLAVLVAVLGARVFHRAQPTFSEVVMAFCVIALGAAIGIPNFVKARTTSCPSACLANLKQIQGAKATWQIELNKAPTDVPADSDLFGPTAYIREKPLCPAGGTYLVGAVGERARCSVGGPGHTLD